MFHPGYCLRYDTGGKGYLTCMGFRDVLHILISFLPSKKVFLMFRESVNVKNVPKAPIRKGMSEYWGMEILSPGCLPVPKRSLRGSIGLLLLDTTWTG